jgi:hypothetical protein
MLICRKCQTALRPDRFVKHFRQAHQLTGDKLRNIDDYYTGVDLANPETEPLLADGGVTIEPLLVLHGYSCGACRYLTVARDNIVRHWREAGHGTAEIRWTEVQLQTWMGGKYARYWIIRYSNEVDNASGVTGIIRLPVHRFVYSLWLDVKFQSPPLMFCSHIKSYNLAADCMKIAELAGEPVK